MEKKIFHLKKDLNSLVNFWKENNEIVGLVPTMGALHAGHLSLIEASNKSCDRTVVSIFVNPTQFGPSEDFDKYPKQIEKDAELCKSVGVDAIFAPNINEMYGEIEKNLYFKVIPPDLYSNKLCGINRQGHFDGVCQIIIKLFNIIQPHKAFFGQKDAQQLFIVKKLVDFMDIPVEIIDCPTVRESDGLAMSSRNTYLTSELRNHAAILNKTLNFIYDLYKAGETDFNSIANLAIKELANNIHFQLEYLKAYNYSNFNQVNELQSDTLVAIAGKVGDIRLIDNIIIK